MIKKNQLVKLSYQLFVEGETPESEVLVESAPAERPLVFVQGIGMMLPKFEEALQGKSAGEDFDFRLFASDAYGEYQEDAVLTLSKELFTIDGVFDSERVFVGNVVPMTTTDGQIVNAQVTDITEQEVTIDLNHPFAGEELHFTGKVLEVRDATADEIDRMLHPKSCCGGGCKGGGCGDDCGNNCGDNCGDGCGKGCGGCE